VLFLKAKPQPKLEAMDTSLNPTKTIHSGLYFEGVGTGAYLSVEPIYGATVLLT